MLLRKILERARFGKRRKDAIPAPPLPSLDIMTQGIQLANLTKQQTL